MKTSNIKRARIKFLAILTLQALLKYSLSCKLKENYFFCFVRSRFKQKEFRADVMLQKRTLD